MKPARIQSLCRYLAVLEVGHYGPSPLNSQKVLSTYFRSNPLSVSLGRQRHRYRWLFSGSFA